MSIERHYRASARAFHRAHVNGPELKDRKHTLPQVVSGLLALMGIACVFYLYSNRLPKWQTVGFKCDGGQAIVLSIPENARRLVYRIGSQSVVADLSHSRLMPSNGRADFMLEGRENALCRDRKPSSVKAIFE